MQVHPVQLCFALVLVLALLAGCGGPEAGQDGRAVSPVTDGKAVSPGMDGGAMSPGTAVETLPKQFIEADATSSAQASPSTPPTSIVGKDGVEMLFVPAGNFIMGAPDQHFDQRPVHEMYTDAFYIDKFEVTNAQYKRFVDVTGHRVPYLDADYAQNYNWRNGTYPAGKDDYPVVLVDWYDAQAYAEWAGKRLPTEPEWEKAARGTDGQIFPWGNDPDVSRMNTWEAGPGETTPVGSYPEGASPYGIMDMAGNVWEWTSDWFERYPGNDDVSDKYGTIYKVLRGSSWGNVIKYARGANRNWVEPWTKNTLTGFRCAVSAP